MRVDIFLEACKFAILSPIILLGYLSAMVTHGFKVGWQIYKDFG